MESDDVVNKIYDAVKVNKDGRVYDSPQKCEWCTGHFIYFTDINGHVWYVAHYPPLEESMV